MRFLVLPMLALLAAPAVAADYLGKVLAVSDGDTFTMQSETGNVRVRICGIDAPERGQPGYGQGCSVFSGQARYRRRNDEIRNSLRLAEILRWTLQDR